MIYVYLCKKCNNIQEENHSYKNITNDEKDIKHQIVCQGCLNLGTMDRKITAVSFNTFGSMNVEQKKDMLKKRSKAHFKKNIEETFHQKNRKDYNP